MNNLEKNIITIICNNKSIRAAKIAKLLGVERRDVNSVLYGSLSAYVYQDTNYEWHIKSIITPPSSASNSSKSVIKPSTQVVVSQNMSSEIGHASVKDSFEEKKERYIKAISKCDNISSSVYKRDICKSYVPITRDSCIGRRLNIDRVWGDIKTNRVICEEKIDRSGWKIYYRDHIIDVSGNELVCPTVRRKYQIGEEEIQLLRSCAEHSREGLIESLVDKDVRNEFLDMLEARWVKLTDCVVKQSIFGCNAKNHTIKDICAQICVLTRSGDVLPIKVWAGYCSNCNQVFILKSEYNIARSYGTLLCSIIEEKKYAKISNGEMELSDESELMRYGYSVGENSYLSVDQRREILKLLVDSNIMTVNKIISYLDFFISMRMNSVNDYSYAIGSWESDKEYIRYYKRNANNPILEKIRYSNITYS